MNQSVTNRYLICLAGCSIRVTRKEFERAVKEYRLRVRKEPPDEDGWIFHFADDLDKESNDQ